MAAAVYDFSFAHSSLRPDQFVQVGASGVIGYVGGDPAKCFSSASEVSAFIDAGVAVGFVHERTVSWRSWDGAAANRAIDSLAPSSPGCYYASDQDVSPADYPQISDALAAQPGRPKGIYGESGLVEFCLDAGSARWGWITSASAWSHDPAPKAALRQLVGQTTIGGTDRNVVLQTDWGQFPALTSPPEEDMLLQLVFPPAVYEDTTLDGTPNPQRGKRHPHAGETWIVMGVLANHVSSPGMLNLYRFLGVGGPQQIHSEWFDNLTLLPSTADLRPGSLPAAVGGPGGPIDLAALGRAASEGVLAGLVAHPLSPRA